jgi:hypothetical protein
VNAKGGSHHRTPLHYASINNHVGVAKLLLNAGANEYARDSGGYTPLNLSLGGEMCKLLHKVSCACAHALYDFAVKHLTYLNLLSLS